MDTKIDDKNQVGKTKEVEEMYRAGVHFGYSCSFSHPKMKPYFYARKDGIVLFDLEKVYEFLEKAVSFIGGLAERGGKFIFVTTKPEAKDIVEKAGRELGMPYVTERWLGGTLTNFAVIKKELDTLRDLRSKKTAGDFSVYSKKDLARVEKKLLKMEEQLGGLESLTDKPEALVIIDPKKEHVALAEAARTKIAVAAFLNSDCDPSGISYPVPGNDRSAASVQYFVDKISEAYKQGLKKKQVN